jgi:hypothetical protein
MNDFELEAPKSPLSRLTHIAEQLREVVGQMRQRGVGLEQVPALSLLEIAKRLVAERKALSDLSDADVFTNGPTNMLLDLYIHSWLNKRVSVSSLTIASCIPPTTALRYIDHFEQTKLVTKTGDDTDGRRVWVALTHASFARVTDYLTKVSRAWAVDIEVRPLPSAFVCE